MVHGFDSISIIKFPAMICSVSAETSQKASHLPLFVLAQFDSSVYIRIQFELCIDSTEDGDHVIS